nr:nonstructural protein NS4A [Hepacivirus rhabdomysis]
SWTGGLLGASAGLLLLYAATDTFGYFACTSSFNVVCRPELRLNETIDEPAIELEEC